MENAWAGETWQCGVTFAVRGGPTELALTWKDVTVTVGESGELWVKLFRPELAALTPDAAAAWLLEQYGAVFGEQTRYFMAARDSGGCSLYFYRPEEDLTQGILQRSILKTWVRLSGGSCEVRLYRPELSDANTVGAYPLVTVDQARQRLAAGQHLSAWEPFPGEDRSSGWTCNTWPGRRTGTSCPTMCSGWNATTGSRACAIAPITFRRWRMPILPACPKAPPGRHNAAYRRFLGYGLLGYGLLGYGLLDTHAIFTLIRAFFPKLQERPPAFAA